MTKEEKLKAYIIETHHSVLNFSKKIDMPYGTIGGVFARGIENSSISTISRICRGLHISLDELVKGNIVENYKIEDEGSIDFKKEKDISNIVDDMKNYLYNSPVVNLDGEPVSKNDLDGIMKTFDITLETYKRK